MSQEYLQVQATSNNSDCTRVLDYLNATSFFECDKDTLDRLIAGFKTIRNWISGICVGGIGCGTCDSNKTEP